MRKPSLAVLVLLLSGCAVGPSSPYYTMPAEVAKEVAAGHRDGELVSLYGEVYEATPRGFTMYVGPFGYGEWVYVRSPGGVNKNVLKDQGVSVLGRARGGSLGANIDAIAVSSTDLHYLVSEEGTVNRWRDGTLFSE